MPRSAVSTSQSTRPLLASTRRMGNGVKNSEVSPEVYYDKILEQQMHFPSSRLDELVFKLLPGPVELAKAIVEMKRVNPNVFQRSEHGQCSRYMDHGLVSSLFLTLLKKKHGTTSSHLASFIQQFRTAMFALRHHTSLILIIEVVEQLATELRACDGDLFNFIHVHKTAMEQMYTYYDGTDESGQLASMVILTFNKVFFMILLANSQPHSALILPPPLENTGTTQGTKSCGGSFGGSVPTNAVVPFHPDWFSTKVPLFENGPYYEWCALWQKNRLHTGVAHLDRDAGSDEERTTGSDQQRQINNDRFFVANILVTTTLGELRKLALEASTLQNKMVGLGTALSTTFFTLIFQTFNDRMAAHSSSNLS